MITIIINNLINNIFISTIKKSAYYCVELLLLLLLLLLLINIFNSFYSLFNV